MALSKKTRFEVFKRDGFRCQYCGNTPPAVTLECDHVIPISKGGKDELENLITACFDCNRGKSDRSLDQVPRALAENAEEIRERHEQVKAYDRLLRSVHGKLDKDAKKVSRIYRGAFPMWELTEHFVEASLKQFLRKLPAVVVEEAMQQACAKIPDSGRAIKYFCGICWQKIRAAE